MTLQSLLQEAFTSWKPSAPEVEARSKHDVTLSWCQQELIFLRPEDLLYRLERKEKIPAWVVVYSGGKTTKRIDNLTPCSPHKFRLRVIIKACEVPHLAQRAIEHYGSEELARKKLKQGLFSNMQEVTTKADFENGGGDSNIIEKGDSIGDRNKEIGGSGDGYKNDIKIEKDFERKKKWLESLWSDEVCTSTESTGTSTTCFCMAVRGGYLKQVQIMLEERPELIGIINSTNGFTPLATAVRKGDLNMVRYLLSMGAEIDQRSSTGQTPLHLAVLASHLQIVELLLEKGADFEARDINDLRVEHYAVDSGDVNTLKLILDRGGNIETRDNNGWTPLFRAIVQSSPTDLIEELVQRGGQVDIHDAAGLSLASAARLLNRHGRSRESIVRLVDSQYPHEKALANFTKLTKKISSLHSLFKT